MLKHELDVSVLWENETVVLSAEESNALENAVQKVWNNRRNSITYYDWISENKQTNQSFLQFVRDRNGEVGVKPSGYIGLISVGQKQYTLLPKIFKDVKSESDIFSYLSLLFQFAYNLKMPDSSDTNAGFELITDLFVEVQIASFSRLVHKTLLNNFHVDYQEESENLQIVRGRIDFRNHIRHNVGRGRQDRIFCQHELFQEDNLLLRIIKYVCRKVLPKTRNIESRKLLNESIALLDGVSDKSCSFSDSLKVKLNTFQRSYKPVLDYCKMFLSYSSSQGAFGNYSIDHVLINTAELFERFVSGIFQAHLPGWKVESRKQGYMARDEHGGIFKYENDILLTSEAMKKTVICDMKYKIIDLNNRAEHYGISSGDLYQMISYATARSVKNVILIYPGIGKESSLARFEVHRAGSQQTIDIAAIQIPMLNKDGEAMVSGFREFLYSLECDC